MAEKVVKQNGVIWLDKTGLSVYLTDKPFLRLNFTPDVFSNLEIIDKLKLENLIREFIKQNSLSYLSFIFIMTSDVLFEKDWSLSQVEIQKKEENDFIDSIPFENTIFHSWVNDNRKKLIACNKDFIAFIKDVFEKENGHMIGVFPYSVFGADIRNETVKEIWKNINNMKQDNLYDESREVPTTKSIEEIQKSKNTDRSLVPVLVVIFLVLIGLLVFIMIKK
ncbi:conserved hypothetical protein [Candidatus Roizmanbacteria bacterium]|nr:conserved hypothetical protein [Candidatus Roizmanbacteria bacterium]